MSELRRSPGTGTGTWAAALAFGAFLALQSLPASRLFAQEAAAASAISAGPLTAADLFSLSVLPEPLVPTTGPAGSAEPAPAENAALAAALDAFQSRARNDDFSALETFAAAHPASPWRLAVLTNLGLLYYHAGYFSKCLPAFHDAWEAGKAATADDPKAKALADRAAGEYTKMLARLGRYPELKSFLQETAQREFTGAGAVLRAAGVDGAATMERTPEHAFRCGPLALSRILASQHSARWTDPAIFNARSTMKGMSLAEVAGVSRQAGLDYQPARRAPGAELIFPSVIHWKVGHYAALLGREGDRLRTEDPTFQSAASPTLAALEAEASGYFLVPPGPLPAGWSAVGADEAAQIFGKGVTDQANPDNTGPDDLDPKPPPCPSPNPAASGDCSGQGGACPDLGMAAYSFHAMLASLKITDTPVGYQPPYGLPGYFTVVYAQRDANQPANFNYSNLGSKWNFNWLTYVTDDPANYATVSQKTPKGGRIDFVYPPGSGSGGNGHYESFPQFKTHKKISRAAANPIPYTITNPDGSKDVFGQPDGSTVAPRKVFLTQHVDPAGNTTTLAYDSKHRLVSVTDPLGRALVLTYGLSSDVYKITRVADPFGRFASFSYDASGRLTSIVDMIGLQSAFTYEGTGDFINSLTTPYGTTTFTNAVNGRIRRVTATDPAGDTEVLETNDLGTDAIKAEPATPAGMNVRNDILFLRNTFYWDKKRWKEAPNDYTKAYIYHWLHDVDFSMMSGFLESEKPPLESRIWYGYPGQGEPAAVGTSSVPSIIGRVVEGGSQFTRRTITDLGKVSQETDPLGRVTNYNFADNGIDVTSVTHAQTTGGAPSLATLATLTYNTAHLPLTYTDAAGKLTSYAWNSHGQITSVTNAKNETTAFLYYAADGGGKQRKSRLYRIDGALAGTSDLVTFDYDGAGNLATIIGPDGYNPAFTYDGLDRLTRATFPDGTYAETVYSRLDPLTTRDRLGRLTHYVYNSLRQLVSVTDPLGRQVQYAWCKCGALQQLIDPLQRVTTWRRDVEGRVVAKEYADGSTIHYGYEPLSGRLATITDEKKQVKTRGYNLDGSLAGIDHTNAEHATPNVAFAYDPDYPRVTKMTDGTGVTTYLYNAVAAGQRGAGRLAGVNGPLSNDTLTYQYDELGRNTGYAINGAGETRTFDALGRLVSAANPLGTFGYTYVAATNRLDKVSYPDGVACQYDYYPLAGDFRLKDIIYTRPGGTVLSRRSYTYDAVGDITRWTQVCPGAGLNRSWLCGYDAAGQLASVASQNPDTLANLPAGQYGYTFDAAGNRLTETIDGVTASTAGNALNQLVSLTSTAAAPLPQQTYEWDAEERLSAVNYTDTTERTEFEYDGYGRRTGVREKQGSAVAAYRRFTWKGLQLAEERDAAGGSVQKRYFFHGMQTIGTGGTLDARLMVRDHLGSVREVYSGAAALTSSYDFDPWGRRRMSAGSVDETSLAFTGHWFHARSGLAVAPYRSYDPGEGRWLSRDPLPMADSRPRAAGLYCYVRNSPLSLVDRLGLADGSCSVGDPPVPPLPPAPPDYDPFDPLDPGSVVALPPTPPPYGYDSVLFSPRLPGPETEPAAGEDPMGDLDPFKDNEVFNSNMSILHGGGGAQDVQRIMTPYSLIPVY